MQIRAHLFTTLYYRRPRDPLRPEAVRYAKWLLSGTNPKSNFGRFTRYYRWVPKSVLFPLLHRTRRDLILFEHKQRFVASCAFQEHPGFQIHSFAFDVVEDLQGNGLCTQLVHAFLDLAHRRRMVIVRLHGDPDAPQNPDSKYDRAAIIEQFNRLRGQEERLGIASLMDKGYLGLNPRWEGRIFTAWDEPRET